MKVLNLIDSVYLNKLKCKNSFLFCILYNLIKKCVYYLCDRWYVCETHCILSEKEMIFFVGFRVGDWR